MSLDKFFNISGKREVEEEEKIAPSKVEDELIKRWKEARYFKEKFGFVPVSVWIPTKKGMYRELIEEYGKYYDLALISTKKVTTAFASVISNVPTWSISISLRNPHVDERVFKLWGGKGYTIYNCFLGHTIEYIIFGMLGAKKYIGGTVNKTVLYINNDFYQKHRHLVPQDYEVTFLEEDATEMRDIPDNSIDLIWASPPYWKAERLKSDHPHELANTESYDEFLELYKRTFKQMYRVMKADRFVVLQVGDVRFEGVFYPLHSDTIRLAQEAGLRLHDIVILYNFSFFTTSTGHRSEERKYTIKTHEYLLVFKR